MGKTHLKSVSLPSRLPVHLEALELKNNSQVHLLPTRVWNMLLCKIQTQKTPSGRRGSYQRVCSEICWSRCHRESEWAMAVPGLSSNTRAKGHRVKLAQSRLGQRKCSFMHWAKWWKSLLQKSVCTKVVYGLSKQLEKSIKDHWTGKPLAVEVHELHITEGQRKILEKFHFIFTF